MNWNESIKLMNFKKHIKLESDKPQLAKKSLNKKMTAKERIDNLLDPGTFVEMYNLVETRTNDFLPSDNKIPGDGVLTGYGKINDQIVFIISEDFSIKGGTLGEGHAIKICKTIDKALELSKPIIFIHDSAGARIQEGIMSLNGYSNIFKRQIKASGKIPQIAVVLGNCAGGACYGPALCDFIFSVSNLTKMFITGPSVIQAVTGQEVSFEQLGGTEVHSSKSGVEHFCYDSEIDCLFGVKKLLSYVYYSKPVNKHFSIHNNILNKKADSYNGIMNIVPDNMRKPYDMYNVIEAICDKNTVFKVHDKFSQNAITCFARINDNNVGIVANQPMCLGGILDCDASDKMARFIRFCDNFSIPIITLVDTPGYYPSIEQEYKGIIRHGAKLIYAYAEATVPKITIILRKAYGGAYIAMNSMGLGADVVYAWPLAEIAVMGAEGAANIILKKEEKHNQEIRDEFIHNYNNFFLNPYEAAKRGCITEVIHPDETKNIIVNSLDLLNDKTFSYLNNKKFKHGNIPL